LFDIWIAATKTIFIKLHMPISSQVVIYCDQAADLLLPDPR